MFSTKEPRYPGIFNAPFPLIISLAFGIMGI